MLKPTEIYGKVVWLGVNPARDSGLQSGAVERLTLTFDGPKGETHAGATRPACSRVKHQYPRNTPIKNCRQLTILSTEEMAEVGAAMGLDGPVRPDWIGGNIQLDGVPVLTEIPSGARFIFENGVGVAVDMENAPCKLAAEAINESRPGQGLDFPKHARGKRGLTAWVEREGDIAIGDVCRLHLPPQKPYPPRD